MPPPIVLHVCIVDFTAHQFVAPVVEDLRRHGIDARIACAPGGPWWQAMKARGVPLHAVDLSREGGLVPLWRSFRNLVDLLHRVRPTVVHVHTPMAALVGRLAAAWMGVPCVIYTVHGFYFHDGQQPVARWFHESLERLLAPLTSGFLFVSGEDARAARRLGIGHGRPAKVVPNGIDPARFRPALRSTAHSAVRSELGLAEDAQLVVYTGRLTREKGVLDLARAFASIVARHPRAHLLMVGGSLPSDRDPALGDLRAMSHEGALAGRLHLLGFRDDVERYLAAADLYCLPSWREGLPVALLEAMAMALPVVTTNVRGCREVAVAGRTALIVPPRDAPRLAAAIAGLLDDPVGRDRLGRAGRERALQFFTRQRQLARTRDFVHRVAARWLE